MLYRILLATDDAETVVTPYVERFASELDLAEKDLENWMAANPELLFGREQVLVISQSIAGRPMADILALDADGRLVIVEIKRNWSDRKTVGQLLEYAAEMAGKTYDDLEKLHEEYWQRCHGATPDDSLLERFRGLVDNPEFAEEGIPRGHRICIVAPGSDEGLLRIVEWLKSYGVPIAFVPFRLHANTDATDVLLDLEPLPEVTEPEVRATEWQGDWFFNTNETNAPGAYVRMFDQDVIAVYGYANGPANLAGSAGGQRVFAYVNKIGVLAVGRVVDGQPTAGRTVFRKENEFHVRVQWELVLAEEQGVTLRQVNEAASYILPVRNTFARIYNPDAADWIDKELRQRKGL